MSETTTCIIVPIEPLESSGGGDQEGIILNLKYESTNIHGMQTLKRLDALRKERQLCDVILTVEGHELFAHRALLSCHSNYFLELFLHDDTDATTQKQIYYQIDGLEYPALKLIIQFIYRGSFNLPADMVTKVYLAAHQLRIETIFKACSNYLAEQLTEQNCLSTRLLAMDDELRDRATECIQKNFLAILETREFHTLPSIKIELIGAIKFKPNVMCDLILKWIVQQLQKDNSTTQELCEYMYLLYLNGDKTLHDCADMDDKNTHFSDMIKDYQSYKLSKRSLSTSSGTSTSNETSLFETPNPQLLNIKPTSTAHTLETKLIHITQSTDHSYIAIAIVQGRMLSVAIHMSPPSATPLMPENNHTTPAESKINSDEYHTNNNGTPALATDRECSLASLSTARCGFGIVSVNNTIYAVGGYDRGVCLDTFEQFDPIEDKWTLLPSRMTSRRGRVAAAIVNEKIYVYGGSDGQKELDTAECFDLACADQKWSNIKELPNPVAHGAMCSDDSFVYLIGGCEGDKCKNDCYRYEPAKNTWSPLAPMKFERSQAAVVHFDGKLFVFGGYTSNRCLSSCEILTLSTNTWSLGPNMRENRRGCSAAVYQGKIFVVGGSNGVISLASIEIFDPFLNEWVTSNVNNSDLNVARAGVGVAVCCDKLYAVGGFDGRTFLKSIEIYDEQLQGWYLNKI